MVEDEQAEDQQGLVKELAPTLHEEGAGDLSATVKTVLLGRDPAGTDGILHTGRCSHGVLSADTDAIEKERPDVADDPAILCHTPGCRKHYQTQGHDGSILDQTPATANPVTDNTNENLTYSQSIRFEGNEEKPLTNDDTADFEIVDAGDPSFAAGFEGLPAIGEGSLEKRFDVANGEQDVTGGL